MTAPSSDIYQMQIQNPHAEMPLIIPVLVLCNTPDEELHANIRRNSALPLGWVKFEAPHAQVAVLVGGGPSLAEHLDEIRALVEDGAVIFAMNAASRYLSENGIAVDYQVMADAKPETSSLVDPLAHRHLVASQVDYSTIEAIAALGIPPTLWHLAIEDMEGLFPDKIGWRGGYALVGGGASVGNSALCLAYVLGFRTLHCFGYDSSHRGNESHAYSQPMNQLIPTLAVEWAGESYTVSVAMKAQAEKFQITAQALKQEGCAITVHGDGLLPAMFNTPPVNLTERDKYRLMWQFDGYRDVSPGEGIVPLFLEIARPKGLIVDFGCGTGRASLALRKAGHDVFLVDFADNCRDDEARELPFLEWDLTRPMPMRAPFGLCTDVMEHIPTDDVPTVLANIMDVAGSVFFQISTIQDKFGDVIHQRLHCTVRPHAWWAEQFRSIGAEIAWEQPGQIASCFLVNRTVSETTRNIQ
jgi:uncharacterized Rossmann fold enzyme